MCVCSVVSVCVCVSVSVSVSWSVSVSVSVYVYVYSWYMVKKCVNPIVKKLWIIPHNFVPYSVVCFFIQSDGQIQYGECFV